jgi:hypothetical protein
VSPKPMHCDSLNAQVGNEVLLLYVADEERILSCADDDDFSMIEMD